MIVVLSLNPMFHTAGQNTSMGWWLAMTTVIFMSVFVGWTWWVYRPANRALMASAALMVFDDDDRIVGPHGDDDGGVR